MSVEQCKCNLNIYTHRGLIRLTHANIPDYAEAGVCSTFKNPVSPMYDSCGAYATTNLVKNANFFANNFQNTYNNKVTTYSAPTSCHYNGDVNLGANIAYSECNFPIHNIPVPYQPPQPQPLPKPNASPMMRRVNITENKMHSINNLSRCSSAVSVNRSQSRDPTAQNHLYQSVTKIADIEPSGTMKQNNRLPRIGHSDVMNFGGNGDIIEQPLYVKSKENGSWKTVQNTTYQCQMTSNSDNHNNSRKVIAGNGRGSRDDLLSNSPTFKRNNRTTNVLGLVGETENV